MDIFEKARDIDIIKILNQFSVPKKYKNYQCMFHDDKNPSAYIMKDGKSLYCNTCNKSFSTIDVYMELSGNSDVVDATLCLLEQENFLGFKKSKYKEDLNHVSKKELSIDDRKRMIIKNDKQPFVDYLNSRGISKKVLDKLDKNNILYGVDNLGQQTFITSDDFVLYRHHIAQKNFSGNETKIIEIKDGYMPMIYIVEGIYDALTLLDTPMGANIICLNSLNMEKQFYKLITSNLKEYSKYKFIIAIDNDKIVKVNEDKEVKSEIVIKNMKKFLTSKSIKFSQLEILYKSKCKDINELRLKGLM